MLIRFSDNDAFITLQKGLGDFEIENKSTIFFVWGAVSPLSVCIGEQMVLKLYQ